MEFNKKNVLTFQEECLKGYLRKSGKYSEDDLSFEYQRCFDLILQKISENPTTKNAKFMFSEMEFALYVRIKFTIDGFTANISKKSENGYELEIKWL